MKVMFYIDSMRFGGAQRVMSVLVNYFSARQYEVVLVNESIVEQNLKYYEISENVKRYYLGRSDGNSLKRNWLYIRKLRSIVKHEKPNAIVSFLAPPNYRMLIATCGLHCRKIVSVRNDPYKEYGYGIKKIIANIVFSLADGCVFQTLQASEYFNYRNRKKGTIIMNPVEGVFYNKQYLGDKNEIISVGRLQPQKNSELLIKAFALISDEIPNYSLAFYGNGSELNKLIELSNTLGINNRVLFKGTSTEVAEKLCHAKVFVLSSDYEGMPNALMEAMAVGVPVISTDCPCGGPKTLIENEGQGMLVSCGDVKALAECIKTLTEDDERRKNMTINEKNRAKDFNEERICVLWESFIVKRG